MRSSKWDERGWNVRDNRREEIVHRVVILLDASSIEIFVNDGAAVLSGRYFPYIIDEDERVKFSGKGSYNLRYWELRK